MKSYEVRYVSKKGLVKKMSVYATDVRHAINQAHELEPECRVTAALPESMWNDETHTNRDGSDRPDASDASRTTEPSDT